MDRETLLAMLVSLLEEEMESFFVTSRRRRICAKDLGWTRLTWSAW